MPIRDQPLLLRALYCRPLMLFAAFFGIGAAAARFGLIPTWISLSCAAILIVCYALCRRLGKRRISALLVACGLFFGAARMSLMLDMQPRVQTQYSIALSGTIAGDPYVDAEKGRLVARLTDVSVDGDRLGYDVRLYLRGGINALKKVRVGQHIETAAHLWAAERARNPGGFDFSAYLYRNGMAAYATAQLSDAALSEGSAGFARRLSDLRISLGDRVDLLFPGSAELVRALVLGDRSDMSEDLNESFNRAGVSHVLSISGLHITLLAMAVMKLLQLFLPRRAAFFAALALVVFYGIFVGMQPPVLRSILMYASLGVGQILGRPSDTATRLSIAFLVLLALNPLYLVDAGFVLSFSASAGMFALTPSLNRALRIDRLDTGDRSLRPKALLPRALKYCGTLVSATLAAQLATLPAIVAYYGRLPLFATVANLAVVPLTLAGMLLALPAILLSLLWAPLGPALAFVPDLLMRFLIWVTALCARLPFNDLRLPPFPAWLAIAHVCAIVAISELSTLSKRARQWLLAALPAAACVAVLLAGFGQRGLEIVFLDAGQADAAVIRADGTVHLVDVGLPETPTDDYLHWTALSPTSVFLSHLDMDHAGGLNQLLDGFVPETVYVPAGWQSVEAESGVAESLARAKALGSDIVALAAGDAVDLSEDVRASVLHPRADSGITDPNGISMVLLVEYGEASALFTGDLPIAYEPGPMPDIDVLKVAHHGSNGSSSIMALYSASPSAAIISVGADNRYGHPGGALLERIEGTGAKIYRTDLCGAVTVKFSKNGGARVRTQLAPEG